MLWDSSPESLCVLCAFPLLCASPCILLSAVVTLVHTLGGGRQVCRYERLSPLVPLDRSLEGDFRNVARGDCVVIFSRHKLFQIRRRVERATNQPCAVIYGGLPSGRCIIV